jgi:hypothetical protein
MLKKNVWYPGHRTYKEGADPGFQIRGGGALKKIAPSGGRRENCWGISCEILRQQIIFFPPGSAPVRCSCCKRDKTDVSPNMSGYDVTNRCDDVIPGNS